MIYLELFLGFLKVGCFSFGGAYAAIPLIRDVVLSYQWMDEEMLTYMIAVSESTPGPIMVNIATYVGTSKAGVLGGLLATFAVVLPAFVLVVLITAILSKVIENRYVKAALRGIISCIIGIIFVTGCFMIIQNLFTVKYSQLNIRAVIITIILGIIYFGQRAFSKVKISPIMLIALAAVLGVAGYSI